MAVCKEGRCSPLFPVVGCTAAYTGYLCDSCAPGHFKGVSGDCAPCPQSFYPALAMITLFFLTAAGLVLLFFKRSDPTRRAAFTEKVSRLLPAPLLRDHFTRLFLLHRLGTVPFPKIFSTGLGFASFLAFDFSAAGPECAIPGANFATKWASVVGGLSSVTLIAVWVDLQRTIKANEGARREGGCWPLGLLRRATWPATMSALSAVLPLSASMCWSALTTTTDRASSKTVLFYDVALRVWEYPQVLVSTLSMFLLFFYVVWVCAAAFRAGSMFFNGAPPAVTTLAAWQGVVRMSGFLRSVAVVLSPNPAGSMALLTTVGLVELLAAGAYFDRVHRAMEGGVGGELATQPPVAPPAWAVGQERWGCLHPHLGLALGAVRNRFRTANHVHLWMVLGASFLNFCTGLDYAVAKLDPTSAAANGWGAVLLFLNVTTLLALGYALARDAGPGFFQLFPTAAERAAARLAGGGERGDMQNPLAATAATAAAVGGPAEECWFECTDENGEVYYENLLSGATSWELPPGARLVPAPSSPFLAAGPDAWFELSNERGDRWFENLQSGETSWTLPQNAILVPPPTTPFLNTS